MERAGGARWTTVCLSMYSITENIYYSQLSSVALLLQPEPNCFTSYNTRKGLCSLSLCAIVLRYPTCLLLTFKEARSYFRPLYLATSYTGEESVIRNTNHRMWHTWPMFESRPREHMRWNTNRTFWPQVQFSAFEGSVNYRLSHTLYFILKWLYLALVWFLSDRFSYFLY
jgi:hypothetical protein